LGLEHDGELLVSELLAQSSIDVLEDAPQKRLGVELEAQGANVFNQGLFYDLCGVDEGVGRVAPLPELSQLD